MNFETFLSSGIGLTLVLMLLAACATPEPTIQSTSTPTETLAKWDLIFISDCSGGHVGEKYAEYIEHDLGVEVTSHDFALPSLSARSVLNYLCDPDGLEYNLILRRLGLADLLPEAEVVVFFANPRSAEMGDWDCVSEDPYVVDCSPDTFEPYRADLDAIYDQILALRGDAPLIIRAFDAYNPLYSVFREQGVYEECLGCWENFNQVIHQAATAHNVPVAHVFDAFNGPDHDEDPRDKGLIGPDGIHTSEEGSRLVADLLRELGYEYTVSP